MTYIEAISLLRRELVLHGYSKSKDPKELELLYALSKAQAFIGNKYRLLEKTAEVLLQANTYIYTPAVTASSYPSDVLEIKEVSGLDLVDMAEIIKDVTEGIETTASKWSVRERNLYINVKPIASYHATTNPSAKLTMVYFHRFLLYSGNDNADFTVTAPLSESFLIDETWMELVIALATGYLIPDYMSTAQGLIAAFMEDKPEYRNTTLKYHLGI